MSFAELQVTLIYEIFLQSNYPNSTYSNTILDTFKHGIVRLLPFVLLPLHYIHHDNNDHRYEYIIVMVRWML